MADSCPSKIGTLPSAIVKFQNPSFFVSVRWAPFEQTNLADFLTSGTTITTVFRMDDDMLDDGSNDVRILIVLETIVNECMIFLAMVSMYFMHYRRLTHVDVREQIRARYSLIAAIPGRLEYLQKIIGASDVECVSQLRMSMAAFHLLCHLLETAGGLRSTRHSSVEEQVAMFLSIIAHHTKNRIVKSHFIRSGRTVSKHFHRVLNAVIRLHPQLLVQPEPIDESCTDDRWKWFKGCLGALDGTYIPVTVPRADRPRYRNRKGEIIVNVLAICDRNMNYIYVMTGWEGSAADSRVLRDAVTRSNGLKVPVGNYYLCDNGYTNGEGFLTPYRGVRYHLDDWGVGAALPRNKEEFFNMKHTRARNVIEHSFGIMKKWWAIFRSAMFYPIKVQNRIIMACCLMHNFIRRNMAVDPMEHEVPEFVVNDDVDEDNYVDVVEPTQEWTNWRDELATNMYNEWGG